MHPSRARKSVVVVAAAVALSASACGVERSEQASVRGADSSTAVTSAAKPAPTRPGDLGGTGGVVYLRKAAEATAAVKSMSMSMSMEFDGMPSGGQFGFDMTSQIDVANNRARTEMKMGGLFDILGSAGAGGAASSGDAVLFETIVDGDTTYLRSPLLSSLAGGDASKPWFAASTGDVADSATFKQGNQDPKAFLEFLRKAGGEVTEVGSEEVRGVATTHFHTVLTPAKMIEASSGTDRKKMQEALDQLGASAEVDVPVDVWIDADGMVRKMVLEVSAATAGTDGSKMVVTIELYDFDAPVDITIPKPSEVQQIDLSKFGN